MADIAVTNVPRNGAAVALAAAAASATVVIGGRRRSLVVVTGSTPTTVTCAVPSGANGQGDLADLSFVCAANTFNIIRIGTKYADPTTGKATVAMSGALTGVTCGVMNQTG